jgi:hypothetical protein
VTGPGAAPRWLRTLLPAVLVLLAVWSVVPLAVWWEEKQLSYFSAVWQLWLLAAVIAALALALVLVLSKGRLMGAAARLWQALESVPARAFVAAAALLLALETLLATLLVFAGNPRNVDGFAQLFQAKMFLAGRAWVEPPPPDQIAHFATLHMIVGPERWFSQYPPGQSAVLAAGLALGAWWLLHPLFAALLAWATWRVARFCAGERAARLSLILLCASPFVVLVAGSEMSHLPAATLGMVAAALATMAGARRGLAAAAGAGAVLGLMTAFRPLDAVAAAVPVALLLLMTAPVKWRVLAATGVAGALASLPTLLFNQATTGSWRTFGYTYLWGPQHSLGFHDVPWGVPLTLTRALARSGLDLHQLNAYLFDAVPVLLMIAAGYVAGRARLTARDAVPAAGSVALIALMFAYWHRDFFYGPRLVFTLTPWVVMMASRATSLLAPLPASSRPWLRQGAVLFITVLFAVGLLGITPGNLGRYAAATPVFSLHPDRDAARAGITNAVVVIPDGWGQRLITRMWQEGVPVRRSSRLYAAIDACALHTALDAAARDPAARNRLPATLDSLAARRDPGIEAGLTDDPRLRVPPPERLTPDCRAQVEFDRRGFLHFAPFLYFNAAALDGPVVWARDLGPGGNGALRRRYAGRRFYRYAPTAPDGAPAFTPLEP